jgi:hypothetical protein
MNVTAILPLALVMAAGPKIISAVFFATSSRWQGNSAAYPLGALISVTACHHREQPRELASGFRTPSRAGGWCAR